LPGGNGEGWSFCSSPPSRAIGSGNPFEGPGYELGIDLVALAGFARAWGPAEEPECPPVATRLAALRVSAFTADRSRMARQGNALVVRVDRVVHEEQPAGSGGVFGPGGGAAAEQAQGTGQCGLLAAGIPTIASVHTHGR
jgi:hypothetical protein